MRSILLLLALTCTPVAAGAEGDPVAAAIQDTYQPETRARGIAALQDIVAASPDPRARLALARALSWDGRQEEALVHYQALAADPPPGEETAVERERLQIVLWQGRLGAAEDGFERLVERAPREPAGWIGLAQARRWQGRPLAALEAAERAAVLAPEEPDARAELADAYLDLGMPYRAREALGAGADDERARRIARARRPVASASTSVAADSFGITRIAPRARVEATLPLDLHIAAGGGASDFRADAASLQYRIAAAELAVRRARVAVQGWFAAFQGEDDLLLTAGGGSLRWRAGDRLSTTLRAHRRPLLEAGDPLATDERGFHGAGTGGASDLAAIARRGVDELALSFEAAPLPGAYLYAEGRGMLLTDDNRGLSLAAGTGIDLLRAVGLDTSVAAVARLDTYLVHFEQQNPSYFSPGRFDGHLASGLLRWQGGGFAIQAYGGRSFSLGTSGVGWAAGGGLDWKGERWTVAARAERRDDLFYQVTRGWLGIAASL